jgi:hypothetical protein
LFVTHWPSYLILSISRVRGQQYSFIFGVKNFLEF